MTRTTRGPRPVHRPRPGPSPRTAPRRSRRLTVTKLTRRTIATREGPLTDRGRSRRRRTTSPRPLAPPGGVQESGCTGVGPVRTALYPEHLGPTPPSSPGTHVSHRSGVTPTHGDERGGPCTCTRRHKDKVRPLPDTLTERRATSDRSPGGKTHTMEPLQ